MAETLWRCEAHGSDWYRDWCVITEMARREGHRVVDLDPCRMVEGVWSLPGELVDPADLDYEAAMRPLDKFLHDDPWFPHERYAGELVARIVWAALGVGEPVEGSG
jgi:hypothetical protein